MLTKIRWREPESVNCVCVSWYKDKPAYFTHNQAKEPIYLQAFSIMLIAEKRVIFKIVWNLNLVFDFQFFNSFSH